MARSKQRATKGRNVEPVADRADVYAESVMDSVRVTLQGGTVAPDEASSDPNTRVTFYAVDFPGYISTNDAAATSAMRTLGGLAGLQDQRVSHPKQLKIKLRPEDPYCHPIMGSLKRSPGMMLLKLASTGQQGGGAVPRVEERGSSAVIVDDVYRFKQPADLQLDSAPIYVNKGEQGSWTEQQRQQQQKQPVQDNDQRLHPRIACVPPVFLIEGAAEYGVDTYGSGRESGVPSYLAMRTNEVIVDYGTVGQLMKDDGGYFEASFKDSDARLSPVGHVLRTIFLERPVYLGAPLVLAIKSKMQRGTFSDADANEQLSKLCYRFSSGPWRNCWVRKGYDPRKDSQSGKYQVVTLFKAPGGQGAEGDDGWPLDSGWSNVDDYEALCTLNASGTSQFPARIQLIDVDDEHVRRRLKQAPGKHCDKKIGWQTAFEMEKLCERIGDVLGDDTITVSDSESTEVRLLPFSTIQTFGTRETPTIYAKKRPEAGAADVAAPDTRPLFDILPPEYHTAINKLNLTTKK
jgi:general transcription factor 3C polypeptide 5 (transcription factor C subunit 1)